MSDLQRVVALANATVEQAAKVDQLKNDFEEAKKELRKLECEDLPELMREIGLESLSMPGFKVELSDEVDASISEARRHAAHDWLSRNGFGGLIKTEVIVSFGRGEHDTAVEFVEEIEESGRVPELVERVHPGTLKSFVKEQMAKGVALPFDLLGIYPYTKAKIKKC